MRTPKAMNGNTICVKVEQNVSREIDGVIADIRQLDQYRVVDTSGKIEGLDLMPGDIVTANSSGDQFELDGTVYYLFRNDFISSKVEN